MPTPNDARPDPTSDSTEPSLRHMFHELVRDCYSTGVNIHDPELTGYIADVLTDFTTSDKVYAIRGPNGRPLSTMTEMLAASDPVFGSAWSFTREREVRKHIGDFSLFFAGMFPESHHTARHTTRRAPVDADPSDSLLHMMRAGKESYYVVSQFNVFEYATEAPLFEKLTQHFEGCVFGLHLVRAELDKRSPTTTTPFRQKRLM
jgi:hypothetical protein